MHIPIRAREDSRADLIHTNNREHKTPKKWRCMLRIVLLNLISGISVMQLNLAVVLFNYGSLSQALLVGELLVLIAVSISTICAQSTELMVDIQSFLSIGQTVLYIVVSHRCRRDGGRRDKSNFWQNAFFWLASSLVSIWWAAALTGFYVYTKAESVCQLAPPQEVLQSVKTPCMIYQLCVGASFLAL